MRIVYFDEALTADDADIMARLGMGQYFAEPLLDIPVVKLTGATIILLVFFYSLEYASRFAPLRYVRFIIVPLSTFSR